MLRFGRLIPFVRWLASSADKAGWGGGGGKSVQITGVRQSGRGPETRLCCIYFCPSRYYHYLTIVQISPFRPSLSHSSTDSQYSRFSVKIFSQSALAGGGEIIFSAGA
jgi:hypothetical protein